MEIQQHEKLQPFLLQQLQELQARDHRELQGAVHEKQLVEQALVSNQRQQQLQQEPEQKQNLLLRESKKGKSKKAKNPNFRQWTGSAPRWESPVSPRFP